MATKRHILVAGHKNTDRGGAWKGPESAWTYPMANRIEEEIERRGGQAWVMQEEDGDNDPTDSNRLGLQAVARLAAQKAKAVGGVDSILFIHYGAEPINGFFSIFPDATGLTPGSSVDVRGNNTLDIQLARTLAQHVVKTGMPIRGDGTMSETKSGVGWQGYRLGELYGSIGVRDTTCRLVVEGGNSLDPYEYSLLQSPTWQAKFASAIVDGLEAQFGKFGTAATTPAPKPAIDPNAGKARTFTIRFDLLSRYAPGFWDAKANKSTVHKDSKGRDVILKAGTTGRIKEGPKVVDGVTYYDIEGDFGSAWVQDQVLHTLEIKG